MEILKNWYLDTQQKIDNQLDNIYHKDYKFFHIERFQTLVKHVHRFSGECATCRSFKPDMEHTAENLAECVGTTAQKRKKYEQLLEKILSHMKKEHGLQLPRYYLSLYSFLGFLLGAALALLVSYLIENQINKSYLLVGAALGLSAGQILGNKKEKQLKAENKFL